MYTELKNQHPKREQCFWAFSKIQFDEGIQEHNLHEQLNEKKIVCGGAGLYGTKEGIDSFRQFYEDRRGEIKSKCTPQEIYEYEYNNHECEYTGDDTEATEMVKYYFGYDGLVSLIRK